MARAFSKLSGQGLAFEGEILAHLEGLLPSKALDHSNFLAGGGWSYHGGLRKKEDPEGLMNGCAKLLIFLHS